MSTLFKRTGIVISATSDIATQMCLRWKEIDWAIYGTYNSTDENYHKLLKSNIPLVQCNLLDLSSVDKAAKEISKNSQEWDFLLFAAGSLVPIGPFEKVDFDAWTDSIQINFLNQMRLLHKLLPFRSKIGDNAVLFFAGGGTNNPVNNFSAYTLSKVALIKACELLDSEIPDVKFTIIGPGWVNTKIHKAALNCNEGAALDQVEKTIQKINSNDWVPFNNVIDSFEWALNQPKQIVGGRNFSTAFDCWGSEKLTKLLADDPSMYKLRRNKNNILTKGIL